MSPDPIPSHVVVIPDGNRRFARVHGLPVEEAYAAGARKGVELVEWCLAAGVRHLSLHAASTANVARRTRAELIAMFRALELFCGSVSTQHAVSVHTVGDLSSLPAFVPGRDLLGRLTATGDRAARLVVHLAVNYSPEVDLAPLIAAAAEPALRHLLSHAVPEADLVIRTGGQRRLSGLFPQQCANADLWFTSSLWPALSAADFAEALRWYAGQEHRQGA